MQIYVEGKLSTRKWTDQEGKERYSTEIVGNYLRIINKRDAADAGGFSPSSSPTAQTPDSNAENSGSTPAMEDDLPF